MILKYTDGYAVGLMDTISNKLLNPQHVYNMHVHESLKAHTLLNYYI